MAIDVIQKRLSSAEKIRENGFLTTVRRAVYEDDIRTGTDTRKTWAVLQTSTPKPSSVDVSFGSEIRLLIAALEWDDTAGVFAGLLALAKGDEIEYLGQYLAITVPGEVAPTGEAIVYDSRAAVLTAEKAG